MKPKTYVTSELILNSIWDILLKALGFFAVGLFAVGQFAVNKKNVTEPNLIWLHLTETNIFLNGEVSHGKKSGHFYQVFSIYQYVVIVLIFYYKMTRYLPSKTPIIDWYGRWKWTPDISFIVCSVWYLYNDSALLRFIRWILK